MNFNMEAKNFVENLKNLVPSEGKLAKHGLSDEEITSIQQSFLSEPKKVYRRSINPLFSLIENFDVSTLEIGLVRFLDYPVETENFWRIGYVDADWLVIDKITNQIKVELQDLEDQETYLCAENSEKFLDALYEVAKYIFSEERTSPKNCQQAKICTDLAGSEKCFDFYKMLLSCDE